VTGEFVPGEQEITVVFLADLWPKLGCSATADTLLATCTDGYASIYTAAFIQEYRPFLVLEINGRGPETWPPAGLTFNPGPYVVSVSATLAPAIEKFLDANHKRPWGVSAIEVTTFSERFAPLVAGPRAALTADAQVGREIWLNSCLSCHAGPEGSFGGTKSQRPFEVLRAHAIYNTDYFRRYVRDPKSLMPGARMEPHPHYTDRQLDALIAFLAAGPES
jgi:cytochrome c2